MSNNYRITGASGIHQGDRDYQQDQIILRHHPRTNGCILAVVADGMGGHSGGRKAADQVMLTTEQLFEQFSPARDDPKAMLRQLVEEAHLIIKLTAISAAQEPHSTIAAFLINSNGECHWVHVGDSRIYHFNADQLIKKTRDHSYVQTLIDKGEITEEQARVHPKGNILLGCLGTTEDPPIDFHAIPAVRYGDTFMCCSDGLWHYFTSEELGWALATMTPRQATEFLITQARERAQGKGDNLSLAIVKIEPLPDADAPVVRKIATPSTRSAK